VIESGKLATGIVCITGTEDKSVGNASPNDQ